ncbi:MAG: hypothetical protein AB4058_03515 [Microcystaceae cyanobacterium]
MQLTQKAISDFLIPHFINIWGIILGLLIIYTLVAFVREKEIIFKPINFQRYDLNKITTLLKNKKANLFSILIFCCFLGFYSFLIIYKQDFANYDNDIFTDSVLKGFPYYYPIWPIVGRFFPLGHQEWHLWELLTNRQDPTWYFAFSLIQLMVIILGLLKLLNFSPISVRLIIISLILPIPSFFHSFDSLTIPERNLMFWIIIFMVAIQAYSKSRLYFFGGIALIATHFSLYYKEPAVSLFATFALIRLISCFYQDRQLLKQNSYFYFFKKYHIELIILTLCLVFILLYLGINLPYQSLEYATSRSASPQDTFLHYIKSDIILTIFLITLTIRFSLLTIARQFYEPFWDAIALGTLIYFAAYVKLGLINTYYLAPVDLIATLYITHTIYTNLASHWRKVLFLILGTAILIQNTAQTPKLYLSRLNFIDGRVQITEFLKTYAQQYPNQLMTLYFPYAQQHQLYYLSCFLKYKSLDLVDTLPLSKGDQKDYMLTSPLDFFDNNTCVYWSQYHHCFKQPMPNDNDLIVILPETEINSQELSKWQQKRSLLFHYQPFPRESKMHAYIFLNKENYMF